MGAGDDRRDGFEHDEDAEYDGILGHSDHDGSGHGDGHPGGGDSVGHGDTHPAALGPTGSDAEVSDSTSSDSTSPDSTSPDSAPSDPMSPDSADAVDPTARQLGALFTVALADEPPSRVTPESVLRQVHGESRSAGGGLAAWLASGPLSLKWAGGLVAAAALIGAVVLVGPMLTQSGSATSASMADTGSPAVASESSSSESSEAAIDSAAGAGSAAAGSASAYGAEGDTGAEAAGSAGSAESQSDDRAAGDAASPEAPMMAPQSSSQQTPSAQDSSQRAPSTPSAGATTNEAAPASSPAVYCPLSPLSEGEWSATVAGLPAGITVKRLPGSLCATGALRGNGIEFAAADGAPGGFLWIVVSDAPLGRDGAASDSTVVSVTDGDLTVRVMANPVGAAALTEDGLRELAATVAAAH